MGKKVLVDLSHPFHADIPCWPYFAKPKIDTMHNLAKSGVLTQKIDVVMHCGTHADAPRHVMEREFNGKRARYTHEMPLDAYYGDAVCLDIQVEDWGLITAAHLDDALARAGVKHEELEGMVICLRTGMHLKFDDTRDYYHYSCGCGREAGQWFAKYKPRCVAMDMQALDHPLHTTMGKNGGNVGMNLIGNSGKPITEEYIEKFGIEAYAEFNKETYINVLGKEKYMEAYGDLENHGLEGTWEPCHKFMMGNGIVGVENLGGDLDKVVGKRFKFMAFPIRWWLGDGSMVRCVAEIDEDDLNDVPERTYTFGGF
ncbi:cyclase family protein [Acidaminobacter hydrogenoformans]|uniref:Kynurenine formamidase n=1 Tax=Acidaminobacter hydrogenoformans DSM 2784 TaxID=1120920 RepID=A0A1G5RXX5_9FIRM|nr:cyclase family protein [Acidaminobacter hydrogenoformans]SCZ78600.1 Kynurenine formamidase [Acidaminobacter hydrogenoformans DSM 2784]